MKIIFNLDYHTNYGEQLVLNVVGKKASHTMVTLDGVHWTAEMTTNAKAQTYIDYYYSVKRGDETIRHEWLVEPHRLEFAATKGALYRVYDHWIDIPQDSYLYSSAFTECVAARQRQLSTGTEYERTIRLKVRAPQLRAHERLIVVGAPVYLGAWSVQKGIAMAEHECNEWVASLDADRLPVTFEFKFVAVSDKPDVAPKWETLPNRTITLQEMKGGEVVVYELPQSYFDAYPWRGAGTVVPVFSLKTEGSFGVGDFGDLKRMVDWCVATRQRILQVLPINDTTFTHTWQDSYPYNAISIYALHPQFTDLRQLPELKNTAQKNRFEKLRQELNDLPQIDYERVNNAKIEYLRELFAQEGAAMTSTEAFKQFFADNKEWLVPYAKFCVSRDAALPSKEGAKAKKMAAAAKQEETFWYFVQFNLDQQMRAAHDYARKNGVILKGDIPIGISRDGVEAQVEPKYFNMNGQAGAPPDAFSTNGQNWGFPTYNWDEMLKDGCSWWVRRFRKMQEYFDAYRIDHVLGFFRIWEIPIEAVHGLLGQFSPALAMSREEIEGYGLHFDEEHMTRPFIADWTLDRIFGERADEVKRDYLVRLHDDLWAMKPEYDTQRKVEAAFRDKNDDNLRDGLYALISDVLFVRDRKDASMFHPRIAVQTDFVYEALWDSDKDAFNRLYNDYFYRRNNQFWYHEAMKKLPRLTQATRMLVCAEDLGMVPDCVPWVMEELRILSLEIQSMPKDPSVRFGRLSHNPYRSVCTISTHDMSTLRQWWDEDWDQTQDYYNNVLMRGGAAPHPLPGWLAEHIVGLHLMSPSMLCLLSLQDWLSIDEQLRLPDEQAERINIPSNPRHYWRYRMHLTIEQLLAATQFNNEIKDMITHSGRK